MQLPVDISNLGKEGVLQVSKSRMLPILVDGDEMRELFAFLKTFEIFDVSRKVTAQQARISKEDFLKVYDGYVEGIKKGKLIDETDLRPYFSSVFTVTSDALYAIEVGKDQFLIKPRCPVVQLKRFHFIYTDSFHPGVMGEGSVTWGIQFSYPQLYLDPKTNAIGKVEKNEHFPNTELFQKIAKWVRDHTSPTPFAVQGKTVNQPIRLGKKCFGWINNHPRLKGKNLYVSDRNNPQPSH